MAREEKTTFCRICEPMCGLVATVENGEVVQIRPDRDHPISRGFACPKGIAMTEVQNDPDRVLHPLRRKADGEFERVSWDEAMADIGARLRDVADRHGRDSIGWYMGNPTISSVSHGIWAKGFIDALGTPHYYSPGSQDTATRTVASALLYGSPLVIPIPDLPRTNLLLILGANPWVSQGSLLTVPRVREELAAIAERGGRVVVVDPRRTETARKFEHVPVRPGGDPWLLLSLLHVIFDEKLENGDALERTADGTDELRAQVQRFSPEVTAARSGVPATTVRALARDLAAADGAAVYGRTGTCTTYFGTLANFLIDALNAVTGNLDRPGGVVFPTPPIDFLESMHKNGEDSYGARHSRVGGFPDVIQQMPSGVMADEITTPGTGQLRALVVAAGNPVLSAPDPASLERALPRLDLLVSLDLYVNETNRHADYVLPATTFLEHEDLNLIVLQTQLRPFLQWTERVVPPRGEAREEWTVIRELADAIGIVPFSSSGIRRLGRLTRFITPRLLADLMLRTSTVGNRFGLRPGGLTLRRLRRQPHGIKLADAVPTGVLHKRVFHENGRLKLGPPELAAEIERLLKSEREDPHFPLRLFGRRETRSLNSWMHNSPKLMSGRRRQTLMVHPEDAERCGVADGAAGRLTSRTGSIEAPVEVTDEVMPGSVSLPHGWGHRGGWRLANDSGGANYNLLASAAHDDLEPLAGMSVLNGIHVRLEAVREQGSDAPDSSHVAQLS